MSRQEIESLKQTLRNAQKQGDIHDIIDCYNALGEEYRKKGDEESLRQSIFYHQKEVDTCMDNDLVFESACSNRFLGDAYRELNEIQKAKKCYHNALGFIRQECDHVHSLNEEHTCSSSVIKEERSFLSHCTNLPKLVEYYRSLCNLALTYLNESVKDMEKDLYGESDFHILYRCIPLFHRSLHCIRKAEKLLLSQHSNYIDEEKENEWNKQYSDVLSFVCDALSNLGLAYEDAGDLRHSSQYLFQCIYMKESFLHLPKEQQGDWEVRLSRAKHSLGVCYMKMHLHDEAEKYLQEDLQFCEQRRMKTALNTELYYEACVAEGQTHQSLGTLYFHQHTQLAYQQAQRHYEDALSCFQLVASHIPSSFIQDAKQNLKVLQNTRVAMKEYNELIEKAKSCEEESQKYLLWKQCCEEILKFEQFDDETPFLQLKETVESVFGKESCEYAECVHLYAEFLYNFYSAEEEPTKLNQAKCFCEEAITIYERKEDNESLATTLEVYASILSAIHKAENDEKEIESYQKAASMFASQGSSQLNAYLTCLSNLIITYNRIGKHSIAKKLKNKTDLIRSQQASVTPVDLEEVEEEVEEVEEDAMKIEEEENENASLSDHDLFTIEEGSQIQSNVQKAVWHMETEDDDNDDNDEDSSSHSPLAVVAEYPNTQDTETTLESRLKEKEDALQSEIQQAKENSIHQIKLQLQLALFYQENGYYDQAISNYSHILSILEKSIQHEDIYHHAIRNQSVCLREIKRLEEAIELLNKDVDLLVFRKTRYIGESDYRYYYDCEIQRSYEELGNCYMSEYDQKQDKESLKQAENCYSHSIQAAKRSDPMNLTGALVNYALVQEEQHQIDKAEITFKKAISSWKEPSSLLSQSNQYLAFSHIARAWYNLARVHISQGLISYALKDCSQAYSYDIKSHHRIDLCRTIQLYASLLMEVLARDMESKVSLHCDSILHEMIEVLKQIQKGCSLSESNEIKQTLSFLQHQLDFYYQWSNQFSHRNWNSKNIPDLLSLCIESSIEYPFPIPSLLSIIQTIQQSIPSSSITLSIQQSNISLTPQEVQSWLFFIQLNIYIKTNSFESALSLLQQHPSLSSFDTPVPYDSYSSLLTSFYNTLLLRKQYATTIKGIEGLDSPLSSQQASLILSRLQVLQPSLESSDQSLVRKRLVPGYEREKTRQRMREEEEEEEMIDKPLKQPRMEDEIEKQQTLIHREGVSSTIRIELHIIIEGEELVSWEVFSNENEITVDSIRCRVNSFIRDSFGLQVVILRIVLNDHILQSSIILQENDILIAYCMIPLEQSISDAFQMICRKENYRNSSLYSILQALNQPINGNCYFTSIQQFNLRNLHLSDLDVYYFLLPLRQSLIQLKEIYVDQNCLTDIGAELLSIWLLSNHCPSLQTVSIGNNVWHGKGLDKLLFALRQYNLCSLNIDNLRISDYGIQSVITILKHFIPFVDSTTEKRKLLSFSCRNVCISQTAKSHLFLSFDKLEIKELDMHGVEIPQEIEFRFVELLGKQKSLKKICLSSCNFNLQLLRNLLSTACFSMIERIDLSNNIIPKADMINPLLECALQFLYTHPSCTIDLRFMDIHYVIPQEVQSRLLI